MEQTFPLCQQNGSDTTPLLEVVARRLCQDFSQTNPLIDWKIKNSDLVITVPKLDGNLKDVIHYDPINRKNFVVPSMKDSTEKIAFALRDFYDNLYLYCKRKNFIILPDFKDIGYRLVEGEISLFLNGFSDSFSLFDNNAYVIFAELACESFDFYDSEIRLLCEEVIVSTEEMKHVRSVGFSARNEDEDFADFNQRTTQGQTQLEMARDVVRVLRNYPSVFVVYEQYRNSLSPILLLHYLGSFVGPAHNSFYPSIKDVPELVKIMETLPPPFGLA